MVNRSWPKSPDVPLIKNINIELKDILSEKMKDLAGDSQSTLSIRLRPNGQA